MAEQKQNNVELTDEEKAKRARKRTRTIVAVVSVAVAVLIAAIVLLLLFVKRDPSQNEPPAGHTHSYSSWVVVDEPTCTEEGLRERTCTCGEKETETLDPLGHTPGGAVREKEVAATCTTAGSYEEVVCCTVCEEELSRKTVTVDALGHTAGEAEKENEVAATCLSAGSYEEVVCCTVCGEELSRKTMEVAALGHDHKGKETQRVTCISSGEMTYTCTRCGDSYTEVVAPIDHAWGEPEWSWAEDYSSATATFICERGCGYQEVFTDREIASEETQHASCMQEGKFDHTASVTFNGNEYTDTVTQTTPYEHVVSDAGEYILGNEHHWKLCTQCGAKVKEEHVFEDGAQNCTLCGVTDGQYFSFSEVSGDYSVTQNGTPSFSAAIVLPEYYEAESEDMPITEIATYGFEWNDSFESIVIPDSVTKIGGYAFQYCRSLKSITLPDSVTEISGYAFSTCINLTSVTLPQNLKEIYVNAFTYCEKLTSLTIPDSVTSIVDGAFSFCKALTSVTLPENPQFTTITPGLFEGCSALETIVIPDSVTSIGANAFSECGLKSITIPANVTSIGANAFRECGLKSVTIPNSVTSIGKQAFYGCAIESISIPNSVTSIGDEAFMYCRSLESITIPDKITSIGDGMFIDCDVLTSVDLPASITSIGENAFSQCSALTTITLPENLKTLGKYAFSECGSLPSITIPAGVTSIGEYTFQGCDDLTSLTLPEGLETIGSHAFYMCRSLPSITIPANVTSIGTRAFEDCNQLKSVTFADADAEWTIADNEIFIPDNDDPAANATALTTTYVSSYWSKGGTHVHTAGKWVTDGDNHWKECTVCGARMNEEKHAPTADGYSLGTDWHWFDCKCGERVVGEHDFHDGISQNCTRCGMTDPKYFDVLPADSSDGYALHLNRTYAEIITGTLVFPEYDGSDDDDPITEIGPNFFQMENVTSIVLPDTLKVIDEYAFMRNPITSITIPASVTSIGQRAFDMCRSLPSIIFEDTSSEWSISDGSTFTPSSAPAENARALTETYVECTWTKVTD